MRQLLALLLFFPLITHAYPLVPDDKQTPSDLCTETNPDFWGLRYQEKIPYCNRNVSNGTKKKIYDNYKIPATERTNYTIDHMIPLSIGGSNSIKNLWPENKKVKALRPTLEDKLYEAVRDGKMKQKEAIELVLKAKLAPCDYDGIGANKEGSDACDRK